MENGQIEVLLIDGPAADSIVMRPQCRPFTVLHDFMGRFDFGKGPKIGLPCASVTYHVHTYGESQIDEAFTFWAFPDRGRFVQWESSDLQWAKPLCQQVPGRIYREWHIGSICPTATSVAPSTVKRRVAPSGIRYSVDVPRGYVLPIDTPATRMQEIMNRMNYAAIPDFLSFPR